MKHAALPPNTWLTGTGVCFVCLGRCCSGAHPATVHSNCYNEEVGLEGRKFSGHSGTTGSSPVSSLLTGPSLGDRVISAARSSQTQISIAPITAKTSRGPHRLAKKSGNSTPLSQIKFVHRWYPQLVPNLDCMLPRSHFGRWVHRRFLQTMKFSPSDDGPEFDYDPRGCLFLKRSQVKLLLETHKYLGAVFHEVGVHYTTPQRVLSITTMVFTVGLLVCNALQGSAHNPEHWQRQACLQW